MKKNIYIFILLFPFILSSDNLKTKYDLRISQKEKELIVTLKTGFNSEMPVWKWDEIKKIYICNKKENKLYLFFKSNKSSIIDLWIIRSHISINSGCLDDAYIKIDSLGKLCYYSDAGAASWQIKYFSEFIGDIIPKYYMQKGSGSIIDVSCREANSGLMILKKKLTDKNKDDINYLNLKQANIAISNNLPSSISDLKFVSILKYLEP